LRIQIEGKELISYLKEISQKVGVKSYIVGGVVRDFLLGVENWDIDVVVEGNGIDFAYELNEYIKGELVEYPAFKTATIKKSGISIDVISARREYYDYPAALPRIEFADIYEDMRRRDFTINTLAYDVLEEKILDYFGGIEDLKKGIIRVLHEKSFIDDPTRIFRAIRYSVRYSFEIEANTEALMKDSIKNISLLSEDRIRNELFLILKEPKAKEMIEKVIEYGIDKVIFKDVPVNVDKLDVFVEDLDLSLFRLLILFYKIAEKDVEKVQKALKLNKEHLKALRELIFLREEIKYRRWIRKLRETLESARNEVLKVFEVMEGDKAKKIIESKPYIKGKDIKNLGVSPGPLYGELLDEVFKAKLEGRLKSKEEEISFVKNILRVGKENTSCC